MRAAAILALVIMLGCGHRMLAAQEQAPGREGPSDDAMRTPRLPTTPKLRATMEAIRKAVLTYHTLITHRRLSKLQAQKFADDLRRSSAALADEKSIPAAGPEVAMLADAVRRGADAVAGLAPNRQVMDGLSGVVDALARYGARFEHPGWRSLQDN